MLLEAEVRSLDGLPATLHVGDRYPILTAGYFGPQSFQQTTGSQQLYTPPPSFNFEDLGPDAEGHPQPARHGRGDARPRCRVQGADRAVPNGIPVIASRLLKSKARLALRRVGDGRRACSTAVRPAPFPAWRDFPAFPIWARSPACELARETAVKCWSSSARNSSPRPRNHADPQLLRRLRHAPPHAAVTD